MFPMTLPGEASFDCLGMDRVYEMHINIDVHKLQKEFRSYLSKWGQLIPSKALQGEKSH